jgi:hypothetical protein
MDRVPTGTRLTDEISNSEVDPSELVSKEMSTNEPDRGNTDEFKDSPAVSKHSESGEEDWDTESQNSSSSSLSSSWSRTLDTPKRETVLAPVLEITRRQIVDRVMAEFHSLLDSHIGARGRAGGSESSNSQTTTTAQTGRPTGQVANKRKRNGSDDQNSDLPENDEDADGRMKLAKLIIQSPEDSSRKLACPYYRRNPLHNQRYRSCAGPGWKTVHRMK